MLYFRSVISHIDPRHIAEDKSKSIYVLNQVFQLLDYKDPPPTPAIPEHLALSTVDPKFLIWFLSWQELLAYLIVGSKPRVHKSSDGSTFNRRDSGKGRKSPLETVYSLHSKRERRFGTHRPKTL